jgi:hypothetical protein
MRHHHGDGDGPLGVAPDGAGVPFNEYAARMLRDIDNVRELCRLLETVAGELSPAAAERLDARIASARLFMDALGVMPSMIRVATPEEVARAQRASESAAR